MKETEDKLRFAAVERLQDKMANLSPGSRRFELYDKACELALSPNRQVDDYLIRNVLRDARRIISRKFKPPIISLNEPLPVGIDNAILNGGYVCYNNGATTLEWAGLLNTVTYICEFVHKNAVEVLVCMIDGYDISDTAERTRLSESLVKKIRTNLKKEIKLKFNN